MGFLPVGKKAIPPSLTKRYHKSVIFTITKKLIDILAGFCFNMKIVNGEGRRLIRRTQSQLGNNQKERVSFDITLSFSFYGQDFLLFFF